MKKTLIGLSLFSLVCIANAEPARFMLYLSGKEQARFILEKEIEKNKKSVRAWIERIKNPNYMKKGEYYSRKEQWEANCVKRTLQILNSVTYDLKGETISWSNVPTGLQPLIPGTYAAEYFEILCDPKFPNIESLTTPMDDPEEYAKKVFKVFEENSSK